MKALQPTRTGRLFLATTLTVVVTGWINAKGGVSLAAVEDVLTALDDWNQALRDPVRGVPEAPTFKMATSRTRADLVVDLQVRTTRNVFGGDHPLAGGISSKTTGCKLETQQVSVQGAFLADTFGHSATRNLMRHLLGHALGLGDIDCQCTGDLMDMPHADVIEVDRAISECDLAGIAAIYTAPGCDQIPASVTCTAP